MNNPITSIIVPVYNKEKYIRTCIDSLVHQTLDNVEFIFINDGSTDDSARIISEYQKFDKRIKVINQKNNGAGNARNVGLEMARGKYVMFLDADDFFEIDMIRILVEKAETSKADIVICGAKLYDTDLEQEVGESHGLHKEKFTSDIVIPRENKDVLSMTESCVWNKLFRREFIQNERLEFQDLKNNNDTAFAIVSICLAQIISYVDKNLVYYRIVHDGSNISSKRGQYLNCSLCAFERIVEILKEKGLYRFYKKDVMKEIRKSAIYELSFCQDKSQGKEYLKALKVYLNVRNMYSVRRSFRKMMQN